MQDDKNHPLPAARPRYRWPWFVLGAIILAILLAILWMSKEIGRVRRIRDLNTPAPQTGSDNPTSPSLHVAGRI